MCTFGRMTRILLHATAVTRGWNGYWNKSQHRKLILEKKILPLPLPDLNLWPFDKALFTCARAWRDLFCLLLRKLSSPGQYSCELCGKHFRTEHGIKSHKEKCVDGSPGSCGRWKPKPVMCEVCGRKFPAKLNLKNHMVTHTDERPHKCRFCDATFRHYKSKWGDLITHKRTLTPSQKSKETQINWNTPTKVESLIKTIPMCL